MHLPFAQLKTLLSIVLIAMAASAPASAQEHAARWSGFHIGASGGYAFGHSHARLANDCMPSPAIYCAGGLIEPWSEEIRHRGTGSMAVDGVMLGLTAGTDVQIGRLLVGAEVDVSWTGTEGKRSTSGQTSHLPFNYTVGSGMEASWLSTLRARFGYLVTRDLLLYATGGAAFARLEVSQSYIDDISVLGSRLYANHAHIKTGFAVGAGGEWMLSRNWSVKAEYLRVEFGSVVSRGNAVFLSSPNVIQPHTMSADLSLNIVRVGVNYRF